MGKFKFDVAIGNPPYQETAENTSDDPIYHTFMDAVYDVANKVELITPARFLFNAGKTPKKWNQKMLNDPHFKVMYYNPDPRGVFPNTEIKGGVAVTYHDTGKDFGAIEVFISQPELDAIKKKVHGAPKFASMKTIFHSPDSCKFTNQFVADHPEVVELLSKGHCQDMTSNLFEKLGTEILSEHELDVPCIRILGRAANKRTARYVEQSYVASSDDLDAFKVMLPEASGIGKFGERLSEPFIGKPRECHTQTFVSLGAFQTAKESENLIKYIRTKFFRALLGIMKVTQHTRAIVFKFVPLQDFSSTSDIDWSQPVSAIDQQLYKKYGLDEKEIAFIEKNVKEMA